MSMKWVVPGSNAKILAQAIHCLAKLGEDLYIEGVAEKLSFRTVNMSKTAFASFNFNPDFFSFYPDVNPQEIPRCQISMKAALVVFRFPSAMDRTVEHCAVVLSPTDEKVEFQLKFKAGFTKTNVIRLLECEVLQANYEGESLPSVIKVEAKTATDVLTSFQTMEITWAISNAGIQFRNFSELVDDGDGLRSEVHLPREDLLAVEIESDAELTFCLAELRTILSFAEHISCPLTVSYSQSGKPMFFIVNNEILTAHIVLATLGLSSSQSTTASSANETRHQSQVLSQGRIENGDVSQSADESVCPSQGRLMRVLTRMDHDISKLPGYDEILAPDSDEEI